MLRESKNENYSFPEKRTICRDGTFSAHLPSVKE